MPKKRQSVPQILQIPKTEDRVVPLIRALAANADRVFFVEHAEQRMTERGITRPQIIECLRHGTARSASRPIKTRTGTGVALWSILAACRF